MSDTMARLLSLRRPVREVPLPGGLSIHVRNLTLGELRRIDARAAEDGGDDPAEVGIASTLRMCAAALAEPDGSPAFPAEPTREHLDAVAELLSTEQLQAVIAAAVPTKATAKN